MIYLPEKCLRDRKDCKPLAQIHSDGKKMSFVCCGDVRKRDRAIPQDRFRVCWKNSHVDEMGEYDFRDLTDTVSVLSQAISVDVNRQQNRGKDASYEKR